jgi:hypothetical protein
MTLMERVWIFEHVAVAVERIDFLDPAVASEPDARERGVRIEVRPVSTYAGGSIYASATRTLQPAVCRIDLLESAPGAADRMHWHPEMTEGEPGDRTFDRSMPPDPVGWLTTFLREGVVGLLAGAGAPSGGSEAALAAIGATAGEIGTAVREGLAWAREPWPEVEQDERGMAVGP